MVRCVLLWLPWLCAFAITDEELFQAVDQAVEDGDVAALQAQLEIRPEGVYATRSDGTTLLHVAAWTPYWARFGPAVLQLLLEKWPAGAQARDRDNRIPLHLAAIGKSLGAWQLLLESWPEGIRAKDSAGRTPLHLLWDHCAGSVHQIGPFLESPESVAYLGSPEGGASLGSPESWQQRERMPICCGLVIELGCRHQVSKPWMEAALNLQCRKISSISKEELMLWLDCGGDIRFRDEQGKGLVDQLEDVNAQQYLQEVIASDLLLVTAGDWRTWVSLGGAVILAGAAVCLEQLALKFLQRGQPSVREDPFLEGAKLLVARACVSRMPVRRLWRWLEVCIAIIFSSFALVLVHWLWWLPLVALSYCIPAVAKHCIRAVLRDPVLMLLTSSPIDLSSKAAALFRTLALSGIFYFAFSSHNDISILFFDKYTGDIIHFVYNWSAPAESPWLSQFLSSFVQDKLDNTWRNSYLLSNLIRAVSATTLFVYMVITIVCLVGLYVMCLLFGLLLPCASRILELFGGFSCCAGPVQDVDMEHAAQGLLQKQPAEFHEVHAGIKPEVACAWPLRGSVYKSLVLLLLDVCLDVNSIVMFLFAQYYTLAAVMAFVVVRSTLKQMSLLPPWRFRQAIKDSLHRGILRQDVLDFFEEERRSEALLSAFITIRALFFVVQTADQLAIQLFSLTLSTYRFSVYALQVGDLNHKIHKIQILPHSSSSSTLD